MHLWHDMYVRRDVDDNINVNYICLCPSKSLSISISISISINISVSISVIRSISISITISASRGFSVNVHLHHYLSTLFRHIIPIVPPKASQSVSAALSSGPQERYPLRHRRVARTIEGGTRDCFIPHTKADGDG